MDWHLQTNPAPPLKIHKKKKNSIKHLLKIVKERIGPMKTKAKKSVNIVRRILSINKKVSIRELDFERLVCMAVNEERGCEMSAIPIGSGVLRTSRCFATFFTDLFFTIVGTGCSLSRCPQGPDFLSTALLAYYSSPI